MRTAIVVVLALFVAVPAVAAGSIRSLSPQSVEEGIFEVHLTVFGENLGTLVVYDGPAGRYEVEAYTATNDSATSVVPEKVLNTAGIYAITVAGRGGESNALSFEVRPRPYQHLVVLGHDPITRPATSREGTVVHYQTYAHGGRDPNPVLRCEPPSGSLFRLGPNHVRCVATNSYGERAEGGVYIYIYDAKAPVLTVPGRIVVEADGPDGKVVTFEAKAYDEIDGDLPVTCDPKSGSLFPIGVTVVDCFAEDSSFNPNHASFEVEVKDGGHGGGGLIIDVPDDITAEASSAAGATVEFTVRAYGTDDPEPVVNCDPPSGSTFALGMTTVVCVATDKYENRASGEFRIRVVDTTPPELMLEDITAQADASGSAEVTYAPTATDAVDSYVAVSCTPPSGTRFSAGESTVQCWATDDYENTAAGSFKVRVVDSLPPVIIDIKASPNRLSPANHKLVDVRVTVDATDGSDPMVQCGVVTVTANEAVDAPGSGNTEYDWLITGPFTLQLRAERSGPGNDRIYTIHVTCTDDSRNASNGTVDVIVPKDGASKGGTRTPSDPPPPSTPSNPVKPVKPPKGGKT